MFESVLRLLSYYLVWLDICKIIYNEYLRLGEVWIYRLKLRVLIITHIVQYIVVKLEKV